MSNSSDTAIDIATDVSTRMDAGDDCMTAFTKIGHVKLWVNTRESDLPMGWKDFDSAKRIKVLTTAIEKAIKRVDRKANRIDTIASRVAGSTYPTMQQVEHASLFQLVHWNRYLPSPGEWAIGGNHNEFEKALNHEAPIITRIVERIKELGGITPSVSKAVGWERYQ